MKRKTFLIILLILMACLLFRSVPAYGNEEYRVFIPLVLKNYISPHYDENKGIALVTNQLSDLDMVGAGWYYVWSCDCTRLNDNRYVPMSYAGLVPECLPIDYDGFVLFLNEPNNIAPYGSAIQPIEAAKRYADFVQARPNAKLIVGNASAWSSMWYIEFLIELNTNYPDIPKPQYYGFHGYVESWITVEQLSTWWDATEGFIYHYSGIHPEVWVTEFADTTGNTESFSSLLDVIDSREYMTRYAYFTNRYDPEAEYIPGEWYDFNLVNSNGSLTPIGEVYKIK